MLKEELEKLSVIDLKKMAKERNLEHISGLRKAELIELLADKPEKKSEYDVDICEGVLEVMNDGFGFIRGENYLSSEFDVYVSHSQIRRFNLKTGDFIKGEKRGKIKTERFAALLKVLEVNGLDPDKAKYVPDFEDLTPIFPNERIELSKNVGFLSLRILDLICPVGKGQRGMIVSPPKVGKTTLLKQIALSIVNNYPEMNLIVLLIDERPEEVTDFKEAVVGKNIEIIYSTFDEVPERHKRVSEMTIEHAKRLVEAGKDVVILLDSITRLARAYNLTVTPSGRTLSGGLDPASLYMPKAFFGAARNTREAGSLTILATALTETGSKMDDVVFEEFKGTGNMEVVLSRKLQERRVFPAIDVAKSATRREDLLLTRQQLEAVNIIRRDLSNASYVENGQDSLIRRFVGTKNNDELVREVLLNK